MPIAEASSRKYLWVALLLSLAGWIIFKVVYPLPFVTHDGYYYVEAALLHPTINVWPIGYSWFLMVVRHLPPPVYSVVTLQWLMLLIALLIFFFSWHKLLEPSKWVSNAVFLLLFANPLIFYYSNFILSDSLFLTLSILWFTQLLWIVRRPRPFMVVTNGVLLAMAFMVRYNALYYPLISVLAWGLQWRNKRLMAAGIIFPMILIGAFIQYTGQQTKEITGKWQFSAYGGWKLANNALYVYSHMRPEIVENLPVKFRPLDSAIRVFFKGNAPKSLFEDDVTAGSYFMFGRNSPLIRYMDAQYGKGDFMNAGKWYEIAPFYQSYGAALIQKSPGSFLVYFAGPNLYRYFFPPAEIFGGTNQYAIYEDLDAPLLKTFFNFSGSGRAVVTEAHDYLLYPSSVMFTLSHYFFVFCVVRFLMLGGCRKLPKPILTCICLAVGLWLCDLGFSVLTSAVVLRYQLFVVTMEISFGIFLGQYTWRNLEREKVEIAKPDV